MCTIAGFLKTEKGPIPARRIQRLLEGIDIRGRDAFACVYLLNGNFVKITTSTKEELTLHIKALLLYDVDGLWVTARAIPASERVGGKIDIVRDTQPFYNDRFVVSHNGIIANDKKLSETYQINRVSPVDTSIVPDLLSRIGDNILVEDILQGSFAMCIYDRVLNKLQLITNFMPLKVDYVEEENCIWWASDESLLFDGKQLDYYTTLSLDTKKKEVRYRKHHNNLDEKKVLVICSGGLDSTTTAALYKTLGYDVSLLHISYGQKAEKAEDAATANIAVYMDVNRYVLEASDILRQIGCASPLLGTLDKGDRHWDMESTYSYVGARNLIFASMGLSLAEKLGIGIVSLGLNIDDSSYPDNNITFIDEMDRIAKVSLNWNNQVRVTAPFVHLTKKEIIEVGIEVDSPFHLQVSCYYPEIVGKNIVNCGTCGCDKLREYSFKALGLIDPVKYRQEPDWDQCVQSMSKKGTIPYLSYLHM
jgi:7-cyano-7-deazaguanine synthase